MIIALMAILGHKVASNMFPVRDISITGCHRLSQQDILDTLNIEVGNDSILKVSTSDIEKKLEKLSFVKNASVSKRIIRGILEINLSERKVAAALRHRGENGYCYALIDPQGVLLEKCDNVENIIMIVGMEDLPLVELGKRLDAESVHLALSVIKKSMMDGLYSKISAINANDPNKIFVYFIKKKFVVFISESSIEEGLKNINLVEDKNKKLFYKDGGYLDARFKDVVYKGRN